VLCLTLHKALRLLLGEAKKAWSKTLITPCAPGELGFSARGGKEWCSELGSEAEDSAEGEGKVLVCTSPQTPALSQAGSPRHGALFIRMEQRLWSEGDFEVFIVQVES